MREGWRIFLHSTIQPLAQLVVGAARNSGLLLEINFDRLMASDVTGRARAFNSLVGGGMDLEEAATISGLLEVESE
ncbi:MAG: phage portal protein [Alphaproteobacteria bacterium]|nr:phage portal protein [Alphaproteobacteria bacterium]